MLLTAKGNNPFVQIVPIKLSEAKNDDQCTFGINKKGVKCEDKKDLGLKSKAELKVES